MNAYDHRGAARRAALEQARRELAANKQQRLCPCGVPPANCTTHRTATEEESTDDHDQAL